MVLTDVQWTKRALQCVPMDAEADHGEGLGEQILNARAARGMSQEELARAAGVGLKTLQRLEAGKPGTPRTRGALQSFLRIGPYAPKEGAANDPPLSQARFHELLRALSACYDADVRAAKASGHRDHFAGEAQDEMPPSVNLNNHSDSEDSG